MHHISPLSVEYVRAEVTAVEDPTTASVSFAFTTAGAPSEESWSPGEWEGESVFSGGYHRAVARILVGPGFLELPEGSVSVWVRTSAAPENVVKVAGTVRVS